MNENITENHVDLTAGEMLRNARTTGRRKREIPTISKQLCIREEFLQALEDGNYSQIGEVVYILGFARNYAMELGLNPDEIVNKIKREMGLIADCADDDNSDNEDKSGDGASCAAPDSATGGVRVARNAYRYVHRRWKWFLGGVIVLILLVVGLVWLIPTSDDKPAPIANDAPVVETVSEPKYAMAVRERFGNENKQTANVVLQATQESWVKIEDGRGNTVFSRVLVPGDIYYVPAGDKYKATFGNAGGVDVWVDGKLAPKVGANHTRKSGISMAPDSLMASSDAVVE